MRMRAVLAIAVTVTLVLAGTATASPAAGRWLTKENAGVVEVSDCGSGICGHVLTSERIKADPSIKDAYNKDPTLRSRPIKGMALFTGMTGGPPVWTGKVYNPADGGTYSGKVKLIDADTLSLRGCIVFPLCKTQTWTRLR